MSHDPGSTGYWDTSMPSSCSSWTPEGPLKTRLSGVSARSRRGMAAHPASGSVRGRVHDDTKGEVVSVGRRTRGHQSTLEECELRQTKPARTRLRDGSSGITPKTMPEKCCGGVAQSKKASDEQSHNGATVIPPFRAQQARRGELGALGVAMHADVSTSTTT